MRACARRSSTSHRRPLYRRSGACLMRSGRNCPSPQTAEVPDFGPPARPRYAAARLVALRPAPTQLVALEISAIHRLHLLDESTGSPPRPLRTRARHSAAVVLVHRAPTALFTCSMPGRLFAADAAAISAHDGRDLANRLQRCSRQRRRPIRRPGRLPSATRVTLSSMSVLISFAAVSATLGEAAHFARDHREPAPLIARRAPLRRPRSSASRFVWNAMESMTPMMSAILLGRAIDAAHRLHGRADHFARLSRPSRTPTIASSFGLRRVGSGLLHGARHLFHRRGRFFEARGLLRRPRATGCYCRWRSPRAPP